MWARSPRGKLFRRAGGRITKAELSPAPLDDFDGEAGALEEAIEELIAHIRFRPQVEQQRLLLHLRNLLGIRRLENGVTDGGHPEPDDAGLPSEPLIEIEPRALTPRLLRAGILRSGCVLVRGLVDRAAARQLAEEIESCFDERARHDGDRPFDERYYVPFEPDPRRGVRLLREWIKQGGGVLAVDSPHVSFRVGEVLRRAGLPQLIEEYLGAPPLISGDKTTLRKAEPSTSGAWHQDGKFMGHVRALNLWLSLSDCGQDAPGLDLVPRRLEGHVRTETDEAMMRNQVSQRVAEEAAGDLPILRPRFEPGDALLFDELFLHKTASDPSMTRPRYAIESWFFSPAGFPADYVPLTV